MVERQSFPFFIVVSFRAGPREAAPKQSELLSDFKNLKSLGKGIAPAKTNSTANAVVCRFPAHPLKALQRRKKRRAGPAGKMRQLLEAASKLPRSKQEKISAVLFLKPSSLSTPTVEAPFPFVGYISSGREERV